MWGDNPPLVVKIGTSLLSDEDGRLSERDMDSVVRVLAECVKSGRRVIVVTSGSIGAGRGELEVTKPAKNLQQKQAYAAVGQGLLMHFYHELFQPHGLTVAQLLLTRDALQDREKYLNTRNTLSALLEMGNVVPIVNENDTVAVEEITFGQNDTLAAIVASKIGADLCVILTDVDGLYSRDPDHGGAELLAEVEEVTPEIEAMATGTRSNSAKGGMVTKLEAAKICMRSGVRMVILNGRNPDLLKGAIEGEAVRGTVFHASDQKLSQRKRWIAFGMEARGSLVLDNGAVDAIRDGGKSLLPAGITEVQGQFDVGDLVVLRGPNGEELGRGLVNFSAGDVQQIKGCHTREIAERLGTVQYEEVVHRDNLV